MNIISLFKTEVYKFKYNSTIVLLLSLLSLLIPFLILLGKSFNMPSGGPLPSINDLYEFPNVWEWQGYAGSWLVFFFGGFLILHMYTSEVSYKTMRQNIITGYTKWEYFIAKVSTVVILATYLTLLYVLSSLALGMYHTPGFDFELAIDSNYAPLRFWLMSLGYLSFALLVAAVFRRSGLSMFFYFAYTLVLESILRYTYMYLTEHQSSNFFPLNAIEDNMAFPLARTSNDFLNSEYDFSLINSYEIAGGLSVLYIIVFLGLTWYKIKNSDV